MRERHGPVGGRHRGGRLAPYLTAGIGAEGFATFLLDNPGCHAPGRRLSNPWLRSRPAQAAQARECLTTMVVPHFTPRLEAAFLTTSSEVILDLLASALDAVWPPPR